ncbi:Pol polyprotein [Plakobranchus ocellatus]|uniref:Pol polyprotein n=1 Tax=Plakobranchus ocellatus TaxID=259542 RepID=A0AAV4ALN1_9GAST|nr:Pol polyprotein [Plakobranchus ocellatus]
MEQRNELEELEYWVFFFYLQRSPWFNNSVGVPYIVNVFNTCAAKLRYEANVCDEFEKMENLGIIRRSDAPYACPNVEVPKNDGSSRTCIVYRRLNKLNKCSILTP